ncbi:MAG: autotransporter outer membrane beta-barrel domain-containing protein, partial [Pseudomonadota bacterium]
GSSGRNDGDANAAEIDRETRGFVVGVDRMIGDRVTVGVAGGWLETDVDVGARNSNGTVESAHALAYVGARFGAWGVRGGVGYAATSADTRRRIAFPGFADVVTARYDGAVLQGFVEAGYRMPLGKGHIEPFVSLAALKVESDAFSEAGGPAALSVKAASEQTTISTVGLRFETGTLSGPLTLRGSTGWRHVSGDLDPVGVHAFDGGDPFTVLGAAQSGDAFLANVEARWRVSPAISFGVAYDGVIGSDGQDHAITGSFKVVF